MATIREILKDFFSSGKKPTEAQFHELIDSYYHKTEDGLTISEEGNLGVGVETPDVRLHVDGALKIGDAPDDAKLVPQGTIRWNGVKLQLAFNGAWQDIWAEKAPTPTQNTAFATFAVNKGANSAAAVSSATLAFPPKTVLVQEVSFTIDYNKSKSLQLSASNPFSRAAIQKNLKNLSISLVSSAGVDLWSKTVVLDEGIKTGHKIGAFPVTGSRFIETPSFFVRFSISGSGSGSLSVTVKDVTIKCTVKV